MMLRLLECAMALDKHRNYARAAEQVGVSQPTLTRSIQELERQFSVQLFDRNRSGVEPTIFGRAVLEGAQRIALSMNDLKHEIALLKGLHVGELTIGIGPIVAQTWMPDAVARLLAKHPTLRIRIVTHDWWDLVPALNDRRIEIGIGELESFVDEPEIEVTALPQRAIRFFCRYGHPLLSMKRLTIPQIGAFPLVAPKLPRRANEYMSGTEAMGRIAEDGRYFEPQIECQNFDSCIRIVTTCDAVGLAPLSMLGSLIRKKSLSIVPFEAPWLRSNYGILRLRGRTLSPGAVAFCEQAVAAELRHHEMSQ